MRLSTHTGWHLSQAEESLLISDPRVFLVSLLPLPRMLLRRPWTCTRSYIAGMNVSLWLRPRYRFCLPHSCSGLGLTSIRSPSCQGAAGARTVLGWDLIVRGVGPLVTGKISAVIVMMGSSRAGRRGMTPGSLLLHVRGTRP